MSKINNYNKLVNNNRVVSVSDIINEKELNIHDQIFKTALLNFIEKNSGENQMFSFFTNKTIDELYKYFIVIENRGQDYAEPSTVKLFSKNLNENKPKAILINLGEKDANGNYLYWPEYLYKYTTSLPIQFNYDEYNEEYNELVYIDYVRGEATVFNKLKNAYLQIPLSAINEDTNISDEMSSENTFYNLIKTWQQ